MLNGRGPPWKTNYSRKPRTWYLVNTPKTTTSNRKNKSYTKAIEKAWKQKGIKQKSRRRAT